MTLVAIDAPRLRRTAVWATGALYGRARQLGAGVHRVLRSRRPARGLGPRGPARPSLTRGQRGTAYPRAGWEPREGVGALLRRPAARPQTRYPGRRILYSAHNMPNLAPTCAETGRAGG